MSNICLAHQKPLNVIDLTIHENICQRCALFNPQYKNHNFLEASQLPSHAHQLYSHFQNSFKTLGIEHKQNCFQWLALGQLVGENLATKTKEINHQYDQMVELIEKERKEKINQLTASIEIIKVQYSDKVNKKIMKDFDHLHQKNQLLKQHLHSLNFIAIEKELNQQNRINAVLSLKQELNALESQLSQQLMVAGLNPETDLVLNKKVSEELLLTEEENQFLDMSLSFSKTESSQPKTQISFVSPETDNFSQHSQFSFTKSEKVPSTSKKVLTKSQIRSIHIKNNIRTVILSQLTLNNRQALDAIRKCSSSNFVSKIDLSYNQVTSQLLVNLKRQKSFNKYLKTVVIKGMKLDHRMLKKEGIIVNPNSEKLELGHLTIQL